jgi:DNA polymerase-3 subunit chi
VTRIDFYTHVDDKLRTAWRLTAKAYSHKLRVAVSCPDAATAQRFDHLLWSGMPLAFVPHCAATHKLAPRTPVIIDHTGAEPLHDEVLLNLCSERPPSFSRYQRLIEIVSRDDDDRAGARARFRFYRDRGYEIHTHDLSGGTG